MSLPTKKDFTSTVHNKTENLSSTLSGGLLISAVNGDSSVKSVDGLGEHGGHEVTGKGCVALQVSHGGNLQRVGLDHVSA